MRTLKCCLLILSIPFQILMSSVTLLYQVSILQFICAQAPYSMKGLLIGLGFLVLYFSSCIAYVVQEGFQRKWKHRSYSVKSLTTSCDFWFFITTLIISIAGLVILCAVAKWYKKRERERTHKMIECLLRCTMRGIVSTHDHPHWRKII